MTPELQLATALRRGCTGHDVKRVQEWLTLAGLAVAIDGDYGPATQEAVARFQRRCDLEPDGVVGPRTWRYLVQPMALATGKIFDLGTTPRPLGELVVAYAREQLRARAREVGGQNRGPWVRLYMEGRDGEPWAWCAGFACWCLRQACESLGVPLPIRPSFSCDQLALSARREGRLLREPVGADRARVTPGSLFLVRRTDTDWIHVGIVTATGPETFDTIEGNTNDDGSREGYEVAARVRAWRAGIDFVVS